MQTWNGLMKSVHVLLGKTTRNASIQGCRPQTSLLRLRLNTKQRHSCGCGHNPIWRVLRNPHYHVAQPYVDTTPMVNHEHNSALHRSIYILVHRTLKQNIIVGIACAYRCATITKCFYRCAGIAVVPSPLRSVFLPLVILVHAKKRRRYSFRLHQVSEVEVRRCTELSNTPSVNEFTGICFVNVGMTLMFSPVNRILFLFDRIYFSSPQNSVLNLSHNFW